MKRLVQVLKEEGLYASGIDYQMTQHERYKVIREFLGSSEQILVSVDSYFFDEMGCTPSSIRLIVHYDLPLSKEIYQKNFGIWKRFSKRQTAINFIMPNDSCSLQDIELFYSIKMKEVPEDMKLEI